jgi:peptide chain release factor 1
VLDVPGETHVEISGLDLAQLSNESGGHRLQRVPPTERKGRVHTSTVTVAVLDSSKYQVEQEFDEKDFKLEWFSGTGCGGQHRNKHQNSARITHIPTGIVETSQSRSREASYRDALTRLKQRLKQSAEYQAYKQRSQERKQQVGSGMRGDKVRTYRFQDDIATDHRNNKKVNLAKVMAGNFDLLW